MELASTAPICALDVLGVRVGRHGQQLVEVLRHLAGSHCLTPPLATRRPLAGEPIAPSGAGPASGGHPRYALWVFPPRLACLPQDPSDAVACELSGRERELRRGVLGQPGGDDPHLVDLLGRHARDPAEPALERARGPCLKLLLRW